MSLAAEIERKFLVAHGPSEKRRFYVPLDGLTAEVDVYGGPLDGLITAEVEFESVTDSEGFDPPPWFGEEITGDPSYANQALAKDGKPPERG